MADALFLMSLRVFSLGVTLPLVIGMALGLLGLRWNAVHRWVNGEPVRRRTWRSLWVAFWLWLASVGAFWILLAGQASHDRSFGSDPAQAIVVLGSGTPGGKVSPALAARLDAAVVRAATQPDAIVVVSGGVDFNESRSEAQVMADYLLAKGLPPARIVQESESTSTEQNLLFSRALLEKRGVSAAGAPIEVVTSDFHTLRAGWIARRAGYANVLTVGVPTPLYLRYNAWLREYFAVASSFVLREY